MACLRPSCINDIYYFTAYPSSTSLYHSHSRLQKLNHRGYCFRVRVFRTPPSTLLLRIPSTSKNSILSHSLFLSLEAVPISVFVFCNGRKVRIVVVFCYFLTRGMDI